MGMYLNPGNEGFTEDTNDEFYIDKTGLLGELNRLINTPNKLVALSHARRFGKSQAADTIEAYYSRGCDSGEIFSNFEIASDPTFERHLNQYNLIHWDVSTYTDYCGGDVVPEMISSVLREVATEFPMVDTTIPFPAVLDEIYTRTKIKFVIIIDEWDCVIRNYSASPELVHKYMQFLHALFKSNVSKRFIALGYITGILPIKKIDDESALNNFHEYTMIDSENLTRYYGFTEDEVCTLCERTGMSFEEIRTWYDGYLINGIHMYNPNSVNQAVFFHKIDDYWKNTSSYGALNRYITMNFDGLRDAVIAVLSGQCVPVNVSTFRNDLSQICSKDDALTALIHLGYLGYDKKNALAYLPNYEVALVFQAALRTGNWTEIAQSLERCDQLLQATISGDGKYVADALERAHSAYSSILQYNDENSLSCVITMAYFTAPAYYMGPFREMPGGKGFADMVFIPRDSDGEKPAMIIELKCGGSPLDAIAQIKDRRYYESLQGYQGQIVFVGVSYDKTTKKHSCMIEKHESNRMI